MAASSLSPALRFATALAVPLSLLGLASACADSSSLANAEASEASPGAGGTPALPGPGKPPGADAYDAGPAPGASLPACNAPPGLGRGLKWVRENPMMISGFAVSMGSPTSAAVSEYFDVFHATAAHVSWSGLPTELAGWAAANHPGFRYVSWVARNGTSAGKVLGGVAPLPGRIGYQIGDEPLSQADLNEMLAGAAALKNADPDGLRIINLNNMDEADALRAQAAEAADIDILSYDHYRYTSTAYSGLMKTRNTALAAGKPYWRYLRSFYFTGEKPSGTPSDMRWHTLLGAVLGFTGHSWFVYSIVAGHPDVAPALFETGGDYAATKTPRYQIAAALNEELVHIGRSLALLRSTDVRYVASIPLIKPGSIPAWGMGAGSDPYLSAVKLGGSHDLVVGHFRDDCDEPYVMVQNQAHSGASFPNEGSGSDPFTLEFDFAGATDQALDKAAVLALDTATGNVAHRALTQTGPTTAKLELVLPAGDVFFFKYKNARPFVKQ